LRKTRQFAERERALDSIRGVSIHGFVVVGGEYEPMVDNPVCFSTCDECLEV
jgi:hypothetical protein